MCSGVENMDDAAAAKAVLNPGGYELKVVGHSLGAGTAALLAAEMRDYLLTTPVSKVLRNLQAQGLLKGSLSPGAEVVGADPIAGPATPTPSAETSSFPSLEAGSRRATRIVAQRLSAVVYSSPCCVTAPLAEAFLQSKLLVRTIVEAMKFLAVFLLFYDGIYVINIQQVNVVYGNDIVPRLNHQNLGKLAQELQSPEIQVQSNRWYAHDLRRFILHIKQVGANSGLSPEALEQELIKEEEELRKEEEQREAKKLAAALAASKAEANPKKNDDHTHAANAPSAPPMGTVVGVYSGEEGKDDHMTPLKGDQLETSSDLDAMLGPNLDIQLGPLKPAGMKLTRSFLFVIKHSFYIALQ